MKILIFEDERLTADRLIQLITRYNSKIEVLDVLQSVKQGVKWFSDNPPPEIIFMDIHLSDGSCFELFEKINLETPIIFTTAYDQYAIEAFKVNSVDYLVKPINFKKLRIAVDKYERLKQLNQNINPEVYNDIAQQLTKTHKKRFLIKVGDQLKQIKSKDISYFYFEEGLVFVVTNTNNKYPIDYSLEQLENILDPEMFYRINRKFIVGSDSILKIHSYFNSRLKLMLTPSYEQDVIVSRDKVKGFKEWLNR